MGYENQREAVQPIGRINMEKVLVTGAGGFIGGHLVKRLKEEGFWVRGVDNKLPEYRDTVADEFVVNDLRYYHNCEYATEGINTVYNLAADMGGIGYIGTVMAPLTRHNVLISTNMLEASKNSHVEKFFFSSSACVYPAGLQDHAAIRLKESDAIPADPEPGYGWEKLFTEKMCEYYYSDYSLDTRVARFHNVYGPYGTYDGGREKAPAAICRKIALAKDGDTIEVWGDGEQTRTFLYVDDCVEGIRRLVDSSFAGPVNVGSDRLVSINETVDIVCTIAKKNLKKVHLLHKPLGVKGRSSDNTLIKQKLSWEPKITLEHGLEQTYKWIYDEVHK